MQSRLAIGALTASAAVVAAAVAVSTSGALAPDAPRRPPLGLHVRGRALVDETGRPLRLLGVSRGGMHWLAPDGTCASFDQMHGDPASIRAMAAWHIDAVRLTLNEDCWLGINGAQPATTGPAYQAAIHRFVTALHRERLYAILDLQLNAPGRERSTWSQSMPDADHAPAFWASVAVSFRHDPAVLLDLFNEPHPGPGLARGDPWRCWLQGCQQLGLASNADRRARRRVSWQAVGMQRLVDVVRASGARQPLLLPGVGYANDLRGWEAHRPRDPLGQEVAGFHVHGWNPCHTTGCWEATAGRLARRVPVVTDEIGERDCAHGFIDRYMGWADAHGISYLGWWWLPSPHCRPGSIYDFGLVTDWLGSPTPMGIGLRQHLGALARRGGGGGSR